MSKLKIIDLFAGCGGLLDGFMQTNLYYPLASVEWEKAPLATLSNRLLKKWEILDVDVKSLRFDIQRIDELMNGYSDPQYGASTGLIKLVGNEHVDGIIGGPPCQSYSVAGRIRDKNSMKYDYRNYLFEYYMRVVEQFKPDFFIFENVPGMLSAMPDGTPITDLIKRDIKAKGYEIIEDIQKYALIDLSEFGVPQIRKRVILVGLNAEKFERVDIQSSLIDFYSNILPKYKTDKISVESSIGDLPACYPLSEMVESKNRRNSHSIPIMEISWHYSRYHNSRDIEIFKLLANDIETGSNIFRSSKSLSELYNKMTGSNTKVHKYHVLKKHLPSTTILAHLYKDGLRFIHYDAQQARTITVREAARLQTFDDDFDFIGSMGDAYKMIGNAVPPKFSKFLAYSINDFLNKYRK